MTLGFGTLPRTARRTHESHTRRPVRVISAVYPAQSREQRRLLARNAGHMGRLAALGVALLITAFAVSRVGGGSSEAQASSSGGLPVVVPEARSAAPCADVELRSGLCIVPITPTAAYEMTPHSEGRA
jgi:hypothetical protein